MLRAIVIAAVIFAGLSTTPAGADHDMVYAPCDPEDTRPVAEQVYFIDYQSGDMLRFDDPWWSERPGNGYTNWHHQCRLGTTGVWQAAPILPMAHPPDYTVGVRQDPYGVHECNGLDHVVYWGLIGGESWRDLRDSGWPESETMAMLDARYPILPGMWTFDLADAYVWLNRGALDFTVLDRIYASNDGLPILDRIQQPSQQTARGDCFHFTTDPAYYYSEPEPVQTTTTTPPTTTITPATTTTATPEPEIPQPSLSLSPVLGDYDLFDAEWDGYPFEQTIRLLEERYPPGTPDRFHFRLSIAVEFLRGGGMVRGLDNLWESG